MTLRLGGDGAITGCTSLEEPTISISGLTMTTPIEAVSGTAAAPSYTFSGDTDNGLYYAGTNSIGVSTSGTSAIVVDSSQRVLVGTTSTIGVGNANADIQSAGTTISRFSGAVFANSTNGAVLALGKSRSATVGSNTIVQDGDTLGQIRFAGDDGTDLNSVGASIIARVDGTPGGNDMPGSLAFATTADGSSTTTERMRVDSSGRLLVGLSSFTGEASAVLEGSSVGGTTQAQLWLNRGGTPATDNVLGQIIFGDNTASGRNGAMIQARADLSWNADDYPSRLAFFTTADGASSPTERMRIGNDGQVFIQTTTDRNAYLNIGNSNSADTTSKLRVTGYRNSSFYGIGAIFQAGNDTTAIAIRFAASGGSTVGEIITNGSSTSYNTSSDYRLKENVVDIADGITRIKQLQPKRFNFIADVNTTIDGFLAHEAQIIVPEAVTGTHNEVDDDGNPVYQGIDQSKLVPLLTAALQEAIAKIETLESKVAAFDS